MFAIIPFAMKKVLIASNVQGIAGRNCLTGIVNHINAHNDWSILFAQDADEVSSELLLASVKGGVDGIILSYSGKSPVYDRLMRENVPIVQIHRPDGADGRATDFALLQNDDRAVGAMAAEHLRSKCAFRAYAFIPTETETVWSRQRGEGFASTLRQHGIAVSQPGEATLGDFLAALPRPAAVFCATDLIATNAIVLCNKLKIRVPSQVAVLGVDDDELLCESSRPTLSSVHTDDFGLGQRAAAELARLLRRKRGTARTLTLVPPTAITERDSTKAVPPSGHLIEAALADIRMNYGSGLGVSDIARHLGVSESLLRYRFRTTLGRSVRDELLTTKLEAAKKQLKSTREPASRIAQRCGFASLCRFSHLFKERYGLSPAAWRKKS